MRIRLILVLVLLVVLPTALLSLLASRSLKNRELDLQNNMVAAGLNAIEVVDSQVRDALDRDLRKVRDVLSDCLSKGSRLEFGQRGNTEAALMAAEANALTKNIPTIAQVYLFMNPWGFLFPGSEENQVPAVDQGLVEVLRRKAASAETLTGTIFFSYGEEGYCFSLLKDRKGLYGGYRINPDGVGLILAESTGKFLDKGIRITSNIPGKRADTLIITDPFGAAGSSVPADSLSVRGELTSKRLSPPLENIGLRAFMADPEGVMGGEALRVKLSNWGIVLLAFTVAVGVTVLLFEASAEISRAKARGDFMMGVSHDLRTPISSIKMLAESLQLGNVLDKAKQAKFLETISGECDHLADMIERVLFFMKQEHGASIYSFSETSVGETVKAAVESFRARSGDSVNVVLNVKEDIPFLMIDENAVSKVIYNLLDNARKYSRRKDEGGDLKPEWGEGKRKAEGGDGKQLAVSSEQLAVSSQEERAETNVKETLTTNNPPAATMSQTLRAGQQLSTGPKGVRIEVDVNRVEKWGKDWVAIGIKDYGAGISKREKKLVFRKFYRASLERDGKVGGIGLGLALCRDIIRVHKGRIRVDSELGKGSKFTVYLPVG